MSVSFSALLDRWPSAWVARNKISEFTGGIITPAYLANLDAQDRGPAGRVYVGRKAAYPATEVVRWLEARSKSLEDRYNKDE